MSRSKFYITSLIILLGVIFAGAHAALAKEKAPAIDSRPRHYFQDCNKERIALIKSRMSRGRVRKLCGGKEFLPTESDKNGFTFTVNDQYKSTVTVSGWHPDPKQKIDFLFAKGLFVKAEYNDQNKVNAVSKISRDDFLKGKKK